MKTEIVQSLTDTFEAHAQQAENGIEFWLSRDLQHLLGYDEWRNFTTVISKAKTACEMSGHPIGDHFVDVNKMVDLGSGSQREVDDIMLTRYACYLIAQNGDPRKQQIAFAQTYFAMQTRKVEQIEQRLLEAERISARKKLTSTEKELSETARKYWKVLKGRLDKEGSQLVTNCYQFKMTAEDGKQRLTDVATAETMLRLVQSVPSQARKPSRSSCGWRRWVMSGCRKWPTLPARWIAPARRGRSTGAARSGYSNA